MTTVSQLLKVLDTGSYKLVRRIGYYELIQHGKVVFKCEVLKK